MADFIAFLFYSTALVAIVACVLHFVAPYVVGQFESWLTELWCDFKDWIRDTFRQKGGMDE